MKLGTLVTLKKEDDIDAKIEKVSALGFEYCQISCWDMDAYTDEIAEKILAALEKDGNVAVQGKSILSGHIANGNTKGTNQIKEEQLSMRFIILNKTP